MTEGEEKREGKGELRGGFREIDWRVSEGGSVCERERASAKGRERQTEHAASTLCIAL